MKRTVLVLLGVTLMMWQLTATAPAAHADYFNYPCQPPGVGTGVDVNFIVDAGGQFCDGPTEINLTHLHCESGGATVNIGAFALASAGGLSLGGIGGNGIGGHGGGCSWRCPDNTVAPAPNPPGVGQKSYIDVRSIIKLNKAFCVKEAHLAPAGPTSALVSPDEGFPDDPSKPWEQGDPSIQVNPTPPPPKPEPVAAAPQPEGELPLPALPAPPPLPPLPPLPELPIPGLPK